MSYFRVKPSSHTEHVQLACYFLVYMTHDAFFVNRVNREVMFVISFPIHVTRASRSCSRFWLQVFVLPNSSTCFDLNLSNLSSLLDKDFIIFHLFRWNTNLLATLLMQVLKNRLSRNGICHIRLSRKSGKTSTDRLLFICQTHRLHLTRFTRLY